jgi:hypothetical protein
MGFGFRFRLIKRKPGGHPVDESVQYYHKHGKTEPAENLEIPLYDKVAKVAEAIVVDFFNE